MQYTQTHKAPTDIQLSFHVATHLKDVPPQLSDLTKQELYDLLEIAYAALTIHEDAGLQKLFLRIQKIIPCEHIVSGLGKVNCKEGSQNIVKIVNGSYPADWLSLYMRQGYASVDPVLLYHFRWFKTQVWSETFRRATATDEQKFIDAARWHGLSHGITMGIPDMHNLTGSLFSFSGKSIAKQPRDIAILEFLLPYLHAALTRTVFSASADYPSLTLREREIILWMKEGKTNWEISQIVKISEWTVQFHVKNILKKLKASTRGHAVVIAMEHGLIQL
ncbi:MAG: autoinducer binding domain-containing protein [Nitrospirae bacterium]|nr:autoinducer binding domain-containing protein [Candidatus Troglogloeales bacterium]